MMALLLLLAGTSEAVAAAGNCTFHEGRDYSDPAVAGTEHGKNATSAETCCALCFADPQCAAAAFAKPSSAAGAGVGVVRRQMRARQERLRPVARALPASKRRSGQRRGPGTRAAGVAHSRCSGARSVCPRGGLCTCRYGRSRSPRTGLRSRSRTGRIPRPHRTPAKTMLQKSRRPRSRTTAQRIGAALLGRRCWEPLPLAATLRPTRRGPDRRCTRRTCRQRYRWHLEKNAAQMAAIS